MDHGVHTNTRARRLTVAALALTMLAALAAPPAAAELASVCGDQSGAGLSRIDATTWATSGSSEVEITHFVTGNGIEVVRWRPAPGVSVDVSAWIVTTRSPDTLASEEFQLGGGERQFLDRNLALDVMSVVVCFSTR